MRYRVYYQQDGSCTEEDFTLCYANSKSEAAEVFLKYHPDGVVDHVESVEGDRNLRALAVVADKKELLMSLIEAIEEEGLEARIYRRLCKSWCIEASE